MVVLICACSQKLPHNVLTDRCILGSSEMESTTTAQRCDFPSPSGVQKIPAGPNTELNGCCRPYCRGKESGEHLPLPLHQREVFFWCWCSFLSLKVLHTYTKTRTPCTVADVQICTECTHSVYALF